jgi:hypothetical protein
MVLSAVTNIINGIAKSVIAVGYMTAGAFTLWDGIFWVYVRFCLYSSIFICLFMLGGLVTPFIGLLYMYYMIYKKIKCYNKNIPDSQCF